MKRSSSIVILASLLLMGCSHLGSNGAMIAAANKYEVANALCIHDTTAWSGNAPAYDVLMQAGLGHYTRGTTTTFGSFTPSASLKPFVKVTGTGSEAGEDICVTHVVADSVAASETLGNEAALFAGAVSKNALRVEFRTHIDYGPWNSNPQVQHAFNDLLDASNQFTAVSNWTPSITLVMYDDPVKGWVVLGNP